MSAFIVKTAQKYPLKTHHNAYFGATFNENPFKMTHKSTFMCILSEKQTKWHILCVFWLKRCVFTWNPLVSVHFLTLLCKNDETLTLLTQNVEKVSSAIVNWTT